MVSTQVTVTFLLSLLMAGSQLFGQTATGEVNGTVADPSGAFVPGAAVKLTNQATKIEDQTMTNPTGYFLFINVKPGSYTLQVEARGFKTVQVAPFDVGVSQTVTQPVTLAVGAVSTTVEVTAEAPLLQSSTTELGTVIAERVVNDLPLNGRNFTQLLTLSPGVTPVSTAQNRSIGGVEGNVGIPGSGFADPAFHGQENRSKLYFFDGIINTNIRGPTYIVIPDIDLVQEFKVVGHDAKAEFGGATGGVMNMVSKSGGNSFHGSAFEYVRNDAFDARNAVTEATKSSPSAFRQNQFGAEAGGPIIKNRTFISGGYDGWRYSKPNLMLSYVPTADELNGDFSRFPLLTPAHQIYNPFSQNAAGVRSPFICDASGNPVAPNPDKTQTAGPGTSPCNKLPAGLINPAMQAFMKTYSATANFTGDPRNDFIQNRSETNNSNGFQVRVDHRFRDSDNVFFRYTEQRVSTFTPIGEVAFTEGGSPGRNYGGGWVHTFEPNLILDVRAGYAGRPGVDSGQQNQDTHGLQPMKDAGFKDIDKYQGMLVRLNDPSNSIWTNGSNRDFGIRGPAPRENPNWSITPNVNWLRGNHNLKAGFWFIRAKRVQLNTFQRYTFGDGQTAQTANSTTTGLSLASALLGLPESFDGQLPVLGGGPIQFKYAAWATYVQDEWRLRPRVTLTAGLRFDALTQPQTIDGRVWNAVDIPNEQYVIGLAAMPQPCSVAQKAPCIPDVPSLCSSQGNKPGCIPDPPGGLTLAQAAHSDSIVLAGQPFFAPPPVHDNWGPRIGIAWQVTPNTVLRGGYGLYWDAVPARSQYAQNDLEATPWPDATAFSGSPNTFGNFGPGTHPPFQLVTDIQGNFPTPLPTANPWVTLNNIPVDPHFKDGYSQQWNIEIQRQVNPNLMISAAYVGSTNGRLDYAGRANAARQATPNTTCAPNDTPCNDAYKAAVDNLRPIPFMNAGFTYDTSTGYSHYNALEARVQRRFSNGLFSLISYTWGKSTDVSSGYFNVENGPGGGSTVQNFYDQNSARGVSGYDITHFLSWSTVYELPAGKGKRWFQNRPASWILGDWQANYTLHARSGQPYTLQVNGDIANLSGTGGIGAQNVSGYGRPNIVGEPFQPGPVAANPGCTPPAAIATTSSWFNPCAFVVPKGQFGNLGRTTFRGPSVFNMDFSLFKAVPLPKEGWRVQIRVESFNVFNIQNWSEPSGVNISNNTVGQITSLAHDPRQIQFGLRFIF